MGVSKELKWIRYYPKSRWKGGCSLQLGGFGCLCFHQEVKKQNGGKRRVAHGIVAANFITHVSQMDIKCLTAGFFLKWGWPLLVETLNEEGYPSEFRLAEIHKDKQHALSSSLIPPRVKHHSYRDLNSTRPTPRGTSPLPFQIRFPSPAPVLQTEQVSRTVPVLVQLLETASPRWIWARLYVWTMTGGSLGSARCRVCNTNDVSFVFTLCLISMFIRFYSCFSARFFLPPLFSLCSLKPNVKLIPFAFGLNFQTQEYFCVRKFISLLTHLLRPWRIRACPIVCKMWHLKG